jgi:hypothetical protein
MEAWKVFSFGIGMRRGAQMPDDGESRNPMRADRRETGVWRNRALLRGGNPILPAVPSTRLMGIRPA